MRVHVLKKCKELSNETDTIDNTFIDGWVMVTILGDVERRRRVHLPRTKLRKKGLLKNIKAHSAQLSFLFPAEPPSFSLP